MGDKCSVKVATDRGWHFYNCSKPVTKARNGKFYCTIHDPKYVKEKQKKQSDRYDQRQQRTNNFYVFSDSRVTELRKAATAFTSEEPVTAKEFSDRRERVRKSLAAFKGEK